MRRILQSDTSKPRKALDRGLDYVGGLEKARVRPPAALYVELLDHISYFAQPSALAEDLFHRIRLVSYPNPPLEVWTAVLRCLAQGKQVRAERVLDLFQELRDSGSPGAEVRIDGATYAEVIKGLCRAKRALPRHLSADERRSANRRENLKWYGVAWELSRQMVREGIEPNASVYLALLKGAKRCQDMGRAKGLFHLVKLSLARARSKANPDTYRHLSTLALTDLFQAYASLRFHSPRLRTDDAGAGPEGIAIDEGLTPAPDPVVGHAPLSTTPVPRDIGMFASVPASREQLSAEVEALMGAHIQDLAKAPAAVCTKREVRRLAMLHASYVSVYASHGVLVRCEKAYTDATFPPYSAWSLPGNRTKAPRISWVYRMLLESCEDSKALAEAGKISREAFKEWRGSTTWQQDFEQVPSREADHVAGIWSSWIRLLAKYVLVALSQTVES